MFCKHRDRLNRKISRGNEHGWEGGGIKVDFEKSKWTLELFFFPQRKFGQTFLVKKNFSVKIVFPNSMEKEV